MERRQTASMLVIGNELLTGKLEDRNVSVIARELFALGIRLRRVVMCPDEVEVIAAEVIELARAHDHVFTSGGVGPTHDDVTIEAVAKAFSRSLCRYPDLEATLRGYYGDGAVAEHLAMADLPEGADLLWTDGVPWPLVRVENVFVLPGLPEVFRLKMPMLRAHLPAGRPFVSTEVRIRCDEGDVASLLRDLVEAYPEVMIGSYPRLDDEAPYLMISFDGADRERVTAAARDLVQALPEADVLAGLELKGLDL